jgi:hypothetical protein
VPAASPSALAASPSALAASPSTLAASPSTLAASPSTLAASPSTLAASPSTLSSPARWHSLQFPSLMRLFMRRTFIASRAPARAGDDSGGSPPRGKK